MKKTILIHLAALLLALLPLKALAFDYEVDWPTSGNGKHTLAITIDGCETRFIIEGKDLETFTKKVHDNENGFTTDMIAKARKRAETGCKK